MIKTRFAPSPTGYLHVGNVRTALVNWLFTHKTGGQFLLRIDDTDLERSKAEYTDAIKQDLSWLGIDWDSEEHQSQRFERYAIARQTLIDAGRLYPCYETQEELDVQRKMLASRNLPPIYNRAALKLDPEQKKKYESEGRKPHYRFLLNDEEIQWDDLIRGPAHFKATSMSDPVLIREDGVPLYTLASVVDDGEMSITHVIRGEDHVSNTAVQIQIYQALGYKIPTFAHMALLKTKDGEMSKRLGGNDIRALRDAGILPMAVNSLLAKIGTSDAVEAIPDLNTLAASFDFKKFGRAPANYDVAELEKLNEKLLHQLPFATAKEILTKIPSPLGGGLGWGRGEAVLYQAPLPASPLMGEELEMDEPFWLSIRPNLKNIAEAQQWWDILHGTITATLTPEEKTFVQSTIALLPPEPWNETTYDAWLASVKPTTPRKGKELFMPIRKALTGLEHGPELKKLLPLLGKNKTAGRLKHDA